MRKINKYYLRRGVVSKYRYASKQEQNYNKGTACKSQKKYLTGQFNLIYLL
jgi:hypothetical protein